MTGAVREEPLFTEMITAAEETTIGVTTAETTTAGIMEETVVVITEVITMAGMTVAEIRDMAETEVAVVTEEDSQF